MNLNAFWIQDVFELGHELETKMTVVKNDPETVSKSVDDVSFSCDLLLFSHRDLHSVDFLLSCELIN